LSLTGNFGVASAAAADGNELEVFQLGDLGVDDFGPRIDFSFSSSAFSRFLTLGKRVSKVVRRPPEEAPDDVVVDNGFSYLGQARTENMGVDIAPKESQVPDVTSVFESRDFKSSVGFRSNSRFSESDRFREAGVISGRKLGCDVVDDSVVGETNDGAMEPAYGFLPLSKAKESLAGESMEVPVNRGGNRVKSLLRGG